MERKKEGMDEEALIKAAEELASIFQQIGFRLEKTRALHRAYEGRGTYKGMDFTDDVEALSAIASECNAQSDSIYAEVMKAVTHMAMLRRGVVGVAQRRK